MTLIVGETSYVDVATASAYLADHIDGAAWTAASEEQKAAALVSATRAIDRLPLRGAPVDADQHLAFPRRERTGYGWSVQSAVPQAVLDATCEEALALLDGERRQRQQLQAEGVASFSLGSLSESYRAGATGSASDGVVSQAARQLLRPYIARTFRL